MNDISKIFPTAPSIDKEWTRTGTQDPDVTIDYSIKFNENGLLEKESRKYWAENTSFKNLEDKYNEILQIQVDNTNIFLELLDGKVTIKGVKLLSSDKQIIAKKIADEYSGKAYDLKCAKEEFDVQK